MSLRELAADDLQNILEDTDGFGWPIVVTNPAGQSESLTGFSNDIHLMIDPETGQAVSGRTASVALPLRALIDEGLGYPKGVPDGSMKPWVVSFDDVLGVTHTFKIIEANPDRSLGIVTCTLRAYQSANDDS